MGEDPFKNDIVYDLLKSSMENSKEASIMACQQTKTISQMISTMLLLLNSMGKRVKTKFKTTVVEAKGVLHTIMEESFKRVTIVYSNQNSGNYKQL